nr:beta-D-glucosyl crocetin beta-1,6-glucosyltransferase-like [Ipomoea batatas]
MEYRNQTRSPLKVLLFPWLAYGHVTPYFELAKKLSQKNFKIYFHSTPAILDNIKRNNPVLDDNIELVELRLPSGDDLPPHNHTTKGLPKYLLGSLFQAFQAARSTFPDILDYCSPDLVIFDGFQPWVPDVASSRNIPAVNYLIVGSSAFSYFYHTTYTYKGTSEPFPFPAIYSRDHERKSISVPWESGFIFKGIEKSSEIVLVNSCEEIEGKYIGYLSELSKKKMVPIGPLIHIVEGDDAKIMEWLDKKEELSTLYVSFGSEYYLSPDDMEELAYGLEMSGVNFIWVIRFPEGEQRSINEALPRGFLGRVKERGLMVENWAPQAKILRHNNVGVFLSHCGWNSVLESVHFEVPIIALPMHLDQPAHARMAVELGTALEIQRDENGKLNREVVAKVIKNVLVEGNVKELREKVKQVNKKIKMKGEKQIDDAVEVLTNLCIEYKQQRNDHFG